MKKRIAGLALLLCLLLCAAFGAGAEGGTPPEGKTEAESTFPAENLSGVYLCNLSAMIPSPSSTGSETCHASLSGANGDELVTAARLTMVTGEDKMANAIRVEMQEEGKILLTYDLSFLQKTGSAVYRLELESEHYWYSGEFTADFVDGRKVSLNLERKEVTAPLGWKVPVGDLFDASVLVTEPSGIVQDCFLQSHANSGGREPEDYTLGDGAFLGNREGAYKLVLVAMAGKNRVEFNRLVTVTVDGALGEEWTRAAEEARKQKPEGQPLYDLSGEYLCGFEGLPNFTPVLTSRHFALVPKETDNPYENQEPLIWGRITLLSGDPELDGMLQIKGSNVVMGGLAGLQKEAEAAFLMELESEHYQYTGEIKIRTVSAKSFSVSADFDTVSVPAESEIDLYSYVDASAIHCEPQTHISYILPLSPDTGERKYKSEGYSIDGLSVKTRGPGDYPAALGVKVYQNQVLAFLPVTLHVETPEETAARKNAPPGEAVSASSNSRPSSLIPPGGLLSQGEFTGKEKLNAGCRDLDRFPGGWIYAPSTLPENMRALFVRTTLEISSSDGSKNVTPETFSVEFLSGDEFLREALYFAIDHMDQGSDRLSLCINDDALTEPGSAVFRIRLKGDSLYYETEFPLQVLSWKEHPLFSVRPVESPIPVELAEGEENGYSEAQLTESFFTSHFSDVSSAFPLRDPSSVNEKNILSLYTDKDYMESSSIERDYDDYGNAVWRFRRSGSYAFTCSGFLGNVSFNTRVNFEALPYSILGTDTPSPGGTVSYQVRDLEPGSGRSFTWQLDGEGLRIDEKTGVLTLPEDMPEGTAFTVTAVPSDGGRPVSLRGVVYKGLLGGKKLRRTDPIYGFTLPVIEGSGFTTQRGDTEILCAQPAGNGSSSLQLYHRYEALDIFYENPEDARVLYDRLMLGPDVATILEREDVLMGGHPVRLVIGRSPEGSQRPISFGAIYYVRNYNLLTTVFECDGVPGSEWESLPKVTMSDLRRMLNEMSYDESSNYFKFSDGVLSLSAEKDAKVLYGGGKLKMTAVFANPNRVNRQTGIDAMEWSVVDAETKEPVSGVSVDQKGVVTADRKLEQPLEVQVRVFSPVFRTEALWPLSVYPALSKIEVKPAEVFFYTGTDAEETLTPVMTPDTVPPVGLTWKINKDSIASLTPGENGTAVIRPLAAGKTRAEVSAPGGKKAAVNITVTDPVNALSLTARGRMRPGGTVNLTAKLEPRSAGNKNLEWSLNVDASIATVDAKGQVKISREAAPGTVILVTCKALGAPEPVTETLEITVEE